MPKSPSQRQSQSSRGTEFPAPRPQAMGRTPELPATVQTWSSPVPTRPCHFTQMLLPRHLPDTVVGSELEERRAGGRWRHQSRTRCTSSAGVRGEKTGCPLGVGTTRGGGLLGGVSTGSKPADRGGHPPAASFSWSCPRWQKLPLVPKNCPKWTGG